MIKKKVILLVLVMVLVPFVMGQRCISGGFAGGYAWRNMIIQDAQMHLDTFYTNQANNIFALAGWANDNEQYQSQVQQQARQLWGEEDNRD